MGPLARSLHTCAPPGPVDKYRSSSPGSTDNSCPCQCLQARHLFCCSYLPQAGFSQNRGSQTCSEKLPRLERVTVLERHCQSNAVVLQGTHDRYRVLPTANGCNFNPSSPRFFLVLHCLKSLLAFLASPRLSCLVACLSSRFGRTNFMCLHVRRLQARSGCLE